MKITSLNTMLTEENELLKKKIRYLEDELNIYKYDMLTNFLLRRDFELHFVKFINYTKDTYLTILDINRLHYTNNEFGYSAGDKLIKDTALAIMSKYPNGDYYRIGGDEFAIFTDLPPVNNNIEDTVSATVNILDYETKDDMILELSKRLSKEKAKWYEEHKIERRNR